jgi:hypothetical protein
MVNFMLLPLYSQGNSLHYPLYRRCVNFTAGLDAMEKRKVFCFDWETNPDSSVFQPVA